MFSKFKIEKAPNVLYERGPRHFEVEQSAISLPLLEAYDQHIRQLQAEVQQLLGLWREKKSEPRNAVEFLPAEFKPIEVRIISKIHW